MTKDWKDIHPDFTPETQQEWKDKGFSHEEVKKWAIAFGKIFEVDDYDFCFWLKDTKDLSAEEVDLIYLKELIEEYGNEEECVDNKNWEEIYWEFKHHPNLKKHWKQKNFTYQQVKEWKKVLKLNFKPTDYFFCAWLRDIKQLTPIEVLNHHNVESLKQEFLQSQQISQIQVNPFI